MGRKLVTHVFTVRPKNALFIQFPVDMLRYDRCRPVSENDSAIIAWTFQPRKMKGSKLKDFEVKLTAYEHSQWVPTRGRWESFGWEIIAEGRTLV